MRRIKQTNVAIAAALLTAAMAACTNETPFTQTEGANTPIVIEPMVVPQTKAIINGTTFPQTMDFKVTAKYSDADFTGWTAEDTWFKEELFQHGTTAPEEGGLDTWTSTKFWPKGTGKLHFQAYAPATFNGTATSDGAEGITFTDFINVQGEEAGYPTDLLYSARVVNQTKGEQIKRYGTVGDETHYGVQMAFKHALSQVVFTASTNRDYFSEYEFQIKEIKLTNLHPKGNFKQNLSADTEEFGAETGSNKPKWSVDEAAAPAEYYALKDTASPYTVTTTVNPLPGAADAAASAGTYPFEQLVIIPQEFIAGAATQEGNSQVVITYSMTHKGISGESDIVIDNLTFSKNLADLYLSQSSADDENKAKGFDVGKRYILNIIIGLDQIHIAPRIEPWQDQTLFSAGN